MFDIMKKDDNRDIKDAELLKTETARGCDRMSENGCTSELCPYDISGTPDELKPCNISKRED